MKQQTIERSNQRDGSIKTKLINKLRVAYASGAPDKIMQAHGAVDAELLSLNSSDMGELIYALAALRSAGRSTPTMRMRARIACKPCHAASERQTNRAAFATMAKGSPLVSQPGGNRGEGGGEGGEGGGEGGGVGTP